MFALTKAKRFCTGVSTIGLTVFAMTSASYAQNSLEGREAIVVSPGGAYSTALQNYVEAFEEGTGAKIRVIDVDFDASLAAARTQIAAGNLEWDAMASVDAPFMPPLISDGTIQRVDSSLISGIETLPEAAIHPYGVAVLNAVVTASYSSAEGIAPLTSVKDFFDPNIEGDRAAGGAPSQGALMCMLALSADGVSVPEMVENFDLPRCFAVWDRVKDQVTTWWASGSQMAQIQIDDEVDYCLCWDGRIVQAALANPNWNIAYDNGIQFFTYMVYLNGTENADVLNAFAGYMLEPELQAEFTQIVGYSAPNPGSTEFLPDNLKPFLSVSPEAQAGLITIPDELNAALETRSEEIGEAWMEYISQ